MKLVFAQRPDDPGRQQVSVLPVRRQTEESDLECYWPVGRRKRNEVNNVLNLTVKLGVYVIHVQPTR